MRHLLLAILLSLASSVFAGKPFTVAEDDRVILKSGDWTPTVEQTQRAMARVQTYLEKPEGLDARNKPAVAGILANESGYRVQFLGVKQKGRQILKCIFFPAHHAGGRDSFSDWKDRRIQVLDGGIYFWTFEYDPATNECWRFRTNGNS